MDQKELPRIAGKLRSKYLEMPEEIYRAKGIVIMGKRIKSVIFTTDIAIIRSCNADAVLAVYPFTPQQVISQSIINVAPMPVFVGVGGGITNGVRSAIIAKDAEGDGAWGVVVNAPVTNDNIKLISATVDVPIIATVIHESADIQARLDAGVSILNVSAAARTPIVVKKIREKFPKVPIIATGCELHQLYAAFDRRDFRGYYEKLSRTGGCQRIRGGPCDDPRRDRTDVTM